ncbi:MAG: excinuclease ABC subunit UvrC [Bacteroidota bacterium]|nr:MAG: excinuclease ABC subunit UvrC [Bacteroidota bacterium]
MADLKFILSNLPDLPGVYQFYNQSGSLLYVGKAKSLKKRVASYFSKQKYDSFKTKRLVSQVYDIRHIVVETESDALLLENNIIKTNQPKYNILLKDDKTFPWICIKNEAFPRVFSTRNRINDGSEYYGPYTSVVMVRTLLGLIRELYPIRTCYYQLSSELIKKKKYKVCLEYHLGNCLGPCEGKQSEIDYRESIQQIQYILKGDIQQVQKFLYGLMMDYSEKHQFEDAEKIKSKYEILSRYKSKSAIVNPKIDNVDVFSFYQRESRSYVNFIKILQGAIVQSHTVEIVQQLEESKEDLLLFALLDIREKVGSTTSDVYVPFVLPTVIGIDFTVPKIGDKKKLLELSERNALQFALQSEKKYNEVSNKLSKTSKLLIQLKTDLRLKELPVYIECFDNSNIQGESAVAACVVFRNAKPSKRDYRHYHIKTVEGSNDFASMEEVITRRYKRLLEEGAELPQLIIVDGGKGQLSAAVKSLEGLDLYGKIAILGIAKRLEELYFPGDPVPLYLDKNSYSLRIIQQLRNEAHRFGISFHRKVRSKKMMQTQLLEINGVGPATIQKLLAHFGSVYQLKAQPIDVIASVVTKKQAESIWKYFNEKEGL